MGQEYFMPVRPVDSNAFPGWVKKANYQIVTLQNAAEAMKEVLAADVVAWDTEFDPTPSGQILHCISFSTKPFSGWLIPVRMDHMKNVSLDIALKFIRAFGTRRNVCQMAGAEMKSLLSTWPEHYEGIQKITDDVAVIWYQKDPNEAKDYRESRPARRGGATPSGFSLAAMALKYLKIETPELKNFFESHKFCEIDPEVGRVYAAADADVTLRLYQLGMDPAMRDSFIYKVDIAVIEVLTAIETRGILYDPDRMSAIEKDVHGLVDDTRLDAYAKLKCDTSVNIDSPTQLARHLYNVLQWPIIGKRRKDGLGSTDKTVLARFAESADPNFSEPAQAMAVYKKWKTLHNNFLTKLNDYQNPVTGAIHSRFLSTVVPTGRLANASPNLQQIPQRNERAPLRRAFRARPGYVFLEADYSQIELRVYAGETQEKFFFDAFLNNVDLHLQTASVIFREQITDKEDPRRQFGKTMNFGPIYGMKPEGLAARTDYSIYEAERILDDFFGAMPDAVAWTRDIHARAKKQGGVHTHFGRWRPLPWLHSRIPHEVEFGERSAVNTIVQGTAADIMRIGLVRLHKALKKSHFDAFLVLTIHDSVLLEVHESTDMDEFVEFVAEQLCFPIQGYPPMEIDCKIGRNWHDMEKYENEKEVPEAEDNEPTLKELMLPFLTEENKKQLIHILQANSNGAPSSASVELLLTEQDGNELPLIHINAQGYQTLLQFLVTVAKENSISPTTNVPKVEFV